MYGLFHFSDLLAIISFMRISVEWLKEIIPLNISPYEIAHKLTMAGLEVEAIEEYEGDYVLEVNVTPNRADCLSIFGIARELSALTNLPLRFPEYKVKEEYERGFKVEIRAQDLCKRYAGRVIKGVSISESPQWLKKRLEKSNIRPINNIVDVTNYLLLELGHPLHAFDLNTLKGDKIIVDVAHRKINIITLDGTKRKLSDDSLLIWDEERPIAIAGVMGGKETEVTNSTKNIFLESAWFDPISIRRTSKKLGLTSESSYRFERGADIEMLEKALERAVFLIKTISGGQVYKKIDVYPERFIPPQIKISYEKINRILGMSIPSAEITDILKRLDLKIRQVKEKGYFRVTSPSYRLDLKRDFDLIEEVARLYGYEKISSALPKAVITAELNKNSDLIKKVKTILRMRGFSEAINYSFMNTEYLHLLNIPPDDKRQLAVAIKNPLRKEEAFLRTMLMPSLIQNMSHNLARGIKHISIFELSRVFENKGQILPLESLNLAGIYYKEKAPSLWKDEVEDFYVVKGAVEFIFKEFKFKEYSFIASTEPFLHHGRSADIFLDGEKIGFIGVLLPDIIERLSIKAKASPIVFEINMDKLLSETPQTITYKPIAKFPSIERDIAIVVDESVKAGEVVNLIKRYPSELIEEVSLFDFYKGRNIPQGKKSLGFSIRYRASERTLKDEEIDSIHQGLIRHLIERVGGEIRK